MSFLRWFLLPFSLIYGTIVVIRNFLFNIGILRSQKFSLPIILVGNLSTGGTGKTPMVRKIAELLGESCAPIILSRGYKRKTKGLIFASESNGTVEELGDEPAMYHHSIPYSNVVVCEDRVIAIKAIETKYVNTCAVIMDDGYQHRNIDPGLKILLTSFENLYYKDYLLPVGSLREPGSGVSRADVVIVTKCPQLLDANAKTEIIQNMGLSGSQLVFFSGISYSALKNGINDNSIPLDNLSEYTILLVTGIANPQPLEKELSSKSANVKLMKFTDHHKFSSSDIDNIETEFKSIESVNKIIVTTEKDLQRLISAGINNVTDDFYFAPIAVSLDDESGFEKIINKYVGKH